MNQRHEIPTQKRTDISAFLPDSIAFQVSGAERSRRIRKRSISGCVRRLTVVEQFEQPCSYALGSDCHLLKHRHSEYALNAGLGRLRGYPREVQDTRPDCHRVDALAHFGKICKRRFGREGILYEEHFAA